MGLGCGPVLTKRDRVARKRWWPGCTGVRLRGREGFAGAGRAGSCIAGRETRVAGMHIKFKHHVRTPRIRQYNGVNADAILGGLHD